MSYLKLKREHNLYPQYQGTYINRYYKSLITKDNVFYVNHNEVNKDISVIMFKKTNIWGKVIFVSNDNLAFTEFQNKIQNKNEWEYISPTLSRILKKKIQN